MKIVVIGGTGLIGSKLTSRLRRRGHQVIMASPKTGVNTITGEGLSAAVHGADVIVDVSNSPSFEDNDALSFFQTSGRNLLIAARIARVKHHVALSVVGIDRMQESGYFRAKQVQEDLIQQSGLPYTIVRSTQFYEFINSLIAAGAKGEQVHISPAEAQPVSSDDVVDALTEIALAKPLNGIIEIAGPELFSLPELVVRYLQHMGDTRRIKVDVLARYFGVKLQNRTLIPANNARLGKTTFERWLSHQNAEVAIRERYAV